MQWLILALGVGALLYLGLSGRLGTAAGLRGYKRVLSPEHFLELSRLLAKAKAAALENAAASPRPRVPGVPVPEAASDAAFKTSAGIGVFYTVGRKEQCFLHHLSLSYREGPLAQSAATVLVAFIRGQMSFGDAPCYLRVSGSGVYHFMAEMDERQQAAFAAAPVEQTRIEEVPAILRACCEGGARERFLQDLNSEAGKSWQAELQRAQAAGRRAEGPPKGQDEGPG
jgi:hypothetical protein